MRLGIFAKTFNRNTLDSVLDAVREHGFETVQFNMVCVGRESLPEAVSEETVNHIRQSLLTHRLDMCALSATFNTIHPDLSQREKGIGRFKLLASKARAMGTDLLTLCSGTRNPESMWQFHPQNRSREAWRDLQHTLSKLIETAEEFDVRLGIEPEINNVIDSPEKASRLLREMRSDRLSVIMDPANVFRYEDLPRMEDMLKQAFDLLGAHISLAHAKDVSHRNPLHYGAAGSGVLNYALYMKLLGEVGYQGPVVLHSLSEEEVPESADYVRSFL